MIGINKYKPSRNEEICKQFKYNDPVIPLLGIHTKETRFERDTCTPMFIAALFIIARSWKQPRAHQQMNG